MPCVVGHSKSKFFITAAYVSLLNQVVLLVCAVVLNRTNTIVNKPLLLWCKPQLAADENVRRGYYAVSDLTFCQFPTESESLPACWNQTEVGLHKIRICGEYERYYHAGKILLITASTLFSIAATYQLHMKSNYVHLYLITKTFMGFQTNPELHRSVVFNLSKKDSKEAQLKEMIKNSGSKTDQTNRTNHEGETPLHNSTKAGAIRCTVVLLKAGAVLKKNSRNALPEFNSMLYNPDVLDELIKLRKRRYFPRDVLEELYNQTRQFSTATIPVSDLVKSKQEELFRDKGDFKTRRECILWNYMDDESRRKCQIEKDVDIEV